MINFIIKLSRSTDIFIIIRKELQKIMTDLTSSLKNWQSQDSCTGWWQCSDSLPCHCSNSWDPLPHWQSPFHNELLQLHCRLFSNSPCYSVIVGFGNNNNCCYCFHHFIHLWMGINLQKVKRPDLWFSLFLDEDLLHYQMNHHLHAYLHHYCPKMNNLFQNNAHSLPFS